ncbi:MAG: hypothetical protein ABUS47_16285 [Steroidobacter sp.]
MNWKTAGLLIVMLLPSVAMANVGVRDNLTISLLSPMSSNRPSSTVNQGLTRVYFTASAAWGITGCRSDAGDVQAGDSNVLAAIMMAFATGKQIKVEVDDTLPTANSVCRITAIYVYP